MNNTTEQNTAENIVSDSEVFAKTIVEIDRDSPLYHRMYLLFCDEMHKAVKEGLICTPKRMAALYPIFREINLEMDEIEREFDAFERKAWAKDARRKAKKAKAGAK